MNLLNLCLRIPNLGILLYYLFFIVLIPYILIANSSMEILKYYMPLMVAFAHMLTLSGHKKLFGNLYEMEPKNFVSFISSNFINLFALFGILWQVITYSALDSTSLPRAVVYGIILFIIIFPMARQGLKFVLDNVDFYMREKTEATFEYNWHLFVFGLLYIIFLLGLQAVMLSLVDTSRKKSEHDQLKDKLDMYKQNKVILKREKDKLFKQMKNDKASKNELEAQLREAQMEEDNLNLLINNIKNNVDNNTNRENNNNRANNNNRETKNNNNRETKNNNKANKNNKAARLAETKELLNSITINTLESFAEKQGIKV
jgi:hypothetical protein